MLMRRQFVLTLILMPITFGIWYAAGTLFSAPAVWLCDALFQAVYPHLIDSVWLQGMKMGALTQFGMLGGGNLDGQRGWKPNRTRGQHTIGLLLDRFLRGAPDGFQPAKRVLQVLHRAVLPVGSDGVWLGIHSRQGPFGDGGGTLFYRRHACRRQTSWRSPINLMCC